MMVMGALFFTVPAQASEIAGPENLSVDAVWLQGETLHISVTDKLTGIEQTLELSLDEYAAGSEYVSVQAVDRAGNKSNTIQFKNPFYMPGADPADEPKAPPSESGIPDGAKPAGDGRPFTPDGTGTVVDDVTDGDGKEFFSIETPDGNVFYLIVDRQRNSENVYLLNAVTEDDLASLAKEGDGKSQSGVPNQTPPQTTQPEPTETPPPEPTPAPSENDGGMGSGTVIFIVIAAIAVGGAGYYFKIVRPKQRAADSDDGIDDYEDGDSEYEEDYGDPGEDGDGE
jgi:hypothetical protein